MHKGVKVRQGFHSGAAVGRRTRGVGLGTTTAIALGDGLYRLEGGETVVVTTEEGAEDGEEAGQSAVIVRDFQEYVVEEEEEEEGQQQEIKYSTCK